VALAWLFLCLLLVLPPLYGLATFKARESFHFNFSPADLDLDGDLDVLVHGMRQEPELVVFSGGAFWLNQGGGQAGQFAQVRHEIDGGRDSTTADLDGDGDPDLLGYNGVRLYLGLNQGGRQQGLAGILRPFDSIGPPAEPRYRVTQLGKVVAGDLNGDGKADAIILGCCGVAFASQPEDRDHPNVSWVWFNEIDADDNVPRAKSVAAVDALAGLPVADGALADLDGDGDLDLFAQILATADGFGPGPTGMVLLNDGAGRFRDAGQRLGDAVGASVALGDMDGDGDVDALVGHRRGAAVWINQGGAQGGEAGRFAGSERAVAGDRTRHVVLADLEGDGDLDAVLVGRRRVTFWRNDGQASFTRADQTIPIAKLQDLTAGDFNGDGLPDLFVVAYAQQKPYQVWFNDGAGGFVAATE
jgi:hypothetical protein